MNSTQAPQTQSEWVGGLPTSSPMTFVAKEGQRPLEQVSTRISLHFESARAEGAELFRHEDKESLAARETTLGSREKQDIDWCGKARTERTSPSEHRAGI